MEIVLFLASKQTFFLEIFKDLFLLAYLLNYLYATFNEFVSTLL